MQNVMKKKSDRYIPYYFVAFFVLLAMLDGVFVYLATSTHTGVVKEQAYEKGLAYNEVVKAQHVQDDLGWQSTIELDAGKVTASIRDMQGAVIPLSEVMIYFSRPTQSGYDFSITLQPETQQGHYIAAVSFPLKGQWDATLVSRWQGKSYQKRQRLMVR